MKMRNPFFIENMMQDQPYSSLLLVAPYCDGKCKGCQNLILSEHDICDYSINELVTIYNNNPFVDGITVAGLEICLSGEKFLEDLISFIKEAKITKVTIYSRFNKEDIKLANILAQIQSISIVEELYCKTGEYIQNSEPKKLNFKNSQFFLNWSISLASQNQNFLVIKGNKWLIS